MRDIVHTAHEPGHQSRPFALPGELGPVPASSSCFFWKHFLDQINPKRQHSPESGTTGTGPRSSSFERACRVPFGV